MQLKAGCRRPNIGKVDVMRLEVVRLEEGEAGHRGGRNTESGCSEA